MNPPKFVVKEKFDSIASIYENIINRKAVSNRKQLIKPEGKTLDVGSGTGLLANSDTVCCDLSFNMCKIAKIKHSFVVCCDAENLPFRKNTFNTVIASEVIYYLNSLDSFFDNIHVILKSEGKIIIIKPTRIMTEVDKFRILLRKLGFKRMYFFDVATDYLNTKNVITKMEKNRFKIISRKKFMFGLCVLITGKNT